MGKTFTLGLYPNIGISSSGTPTTNYLPKFASATTIGNSIISENSNEISLNVAFPTLIFNGSRDYALQSNDTSGSFRIIDNTAGLERFSIASTGLATFNNSIVLSATGYVGFGGGNNYIEGDNTNNILRFGTNNVTRVTINASGNVGIGTTSPNTGKLEISTGGNRNVVISNDDTDTGYNIVSLNGSRTKGSYIGLAGGGTGDNNLYLNSALDIVFQTGASFTQRMRITSGGNVGIGNSSPLSALSFANGTGNKIDFYNDGSNRYTAQINNNELRFYTAAAADVISLYANNIIGLVNKNGNIGIGTNNPSYQLQLSTDSAGKPNGGSWANSSDIRLKENVKTIDNALDKIMQLRGVTFDWKDETEQDNIKSSAGFIADEVMLAFPNWVKEVNASSNQKELINDDKIKSLSLPFEFDAMLVEAIKQLSAQNQDLKSRLDKAGL